MDDKDTLIQEQRAATAERDEAVKKLKEFKDRGERMPAELKSKAEDANARAISLGERISKMEKEHAAQLAEDNEFYAQLQGNSAKITAALDTRDVNDIADPTRRDAMITHETEAALRDVVRDIVGSRMDTPPGTRIDPDSEQLVRDMLMCNPDMRSVNEAGWAQRRMEIAQRNGRGFGAQERVNVVGADTTTTTGGILVPDDNSFMSQVQLATHAYGGVKRVARTFTTSDAAPLPIPTSYSAITTGAKATENVNVSDFDMVFGEKAMHGFMATSGRLGMTFQLMQDAAPNLPMLLGMIAGNRIERKEADWFINGSGATGYVAGEPQGLNAGYQVAGYTFYYDVGEGHLTLAADGDASTVANRFDLWVKAFRDLKYCVDPSYRASMNFSLVLNDYLDSQFAGATDKDNNILRGFDRWLFGNTSRGTGMNFGGMNILSDYSIKGVPTAASADPSVDRRGWIGDFNWFWIRRITGMYMIRDPYTDSRKMTTHWIFGRRCDSECLFNVDSDPTTAAVKCILMDAHA